VLTTLFLAVCLSSAPLPALPAAPDLGIASVPENGAGPVTAAEPAAAPDPDFAVWLAEQETVARSTPAFQLAACRTCSQCPPSQPFCCILASGCASCTSRGRWSALREGWPGPKGTR
jgi:hypothetical protein